VRTNLKALYGFALIGSAGEIGTVEDFYFDDTSWRVKFMVVDTGAWLTSRRVITSTQSVEDIDWESSRFHTQLTTEQIKESPDIDTEKHMGREHEEILVRHYHLHSHWPEAGMFGIPPFLPAPPIQVEPPDKVIQRAESHLVVASEVIGCSVEAADGHLGILHDFMIQGAWQIGEIVVNTGSPVIGKKVWIPLSAISGLNWKENIIRLNFSYKIAKKSREVSSTGPGDR
jgi:hypothetical protein